MPNPGDEHTAGAVPEEPTPEGLRIEAEVERRVGHMAQASAIDDYASAWEADRKAASEMAVERQDLLARIEALENQKCERCGSELFVRCLVCAGDEPAALAEEKPR